MNAPLAPVPVLPPAARKRKPAAPAQAAKKKRQKVFRADGDGYVTVKTAASSLSYTCSPQGRFFNRRGDEIDAALVVLYYLEAGAAVPEAVLAAFRAEVHAAAVRRLV